MTQTARHPAPTRPFDVAAATGWNREQIELIKRTVAVGATDAELALFLATAKRLGLDPFARQIHFVKRRRKNPVTGQYEEVAVIQIGIDGFRALAERTGKLAGIKRGVVRDENGRVVAAWAEVYRTDWREPVREEVLYDEYCQRDSQGRPTGLWATMPGQQLKKCAEAMALRIAFPQDLSGVYVHEEMDQAGEPITVAAGGNGGAQEEAAADAAAPQADEAQVPGDIQEPPLAPLASEQQRKMFFAVAKKAGYTDAELRELVRAVTGKDSSKDVTAPDMSMLIDAVQGKLPPDQERNVQTLVKTNIACKVESWAESQGHDPQEARELAFVHINQGYEDASLKQLLALAVNPAPIMAAVAGELIARRMTEAPAWEDVPEINYDQGENEGPNPV